MNNDKMRRENDEMRKKKLMKHEWNWEKLNEKEAKEAKEAK